MSKTIELAFMSGKVLKIEIESKSIADFFETYASESDLPSWLVFPDGTAVRTENIDWMRIDR